jgi:hypothetical protein
MAQEFEQHREPLIAGEFAVKRAVCFLGFSETAEPRSRLSHGLNLPRRGVAPKQFQEL